MAAIHTTDIQLYNALKLKLDDAEAEQLVSYVKESVKQEVSDKVPNIATKDFVEARIAAVEAKLSEAKFQIILWAFVFWVSQLAALFAFLKYFI